MPLFKITATASAGVTKRFNYWYQTYQKGEVLITLEADKLPDQVENIDSISFYISTPDTTDMLAITSIKFFEGDYVIFKDNAPFTRSAVTEAIEFMLKQIPAVFPNITIPDGYPKERPFIR